MVTRVSTVAFEGIEAKPVDVQVQVMPGRVVFNIVGLPDKAVGESRERVRAALVDRRMQEPFDERRPATCVERLAIDGEFEDVVRGDGFGGERTRHQEPVGILRVTGRHVPRSVEHVLVDEDATGRGEVLPQVR